mgnify:CR=1 FL=1
MDRRTKYRHLLWWIICLDLLTVIWLGYRYLDRKIPDELYVTESQEQQVKNVLDYPLLSLMMQYGFRRWKLSVIQQNFGSDTV